MNALKLFWKNHGTKIIGYATAFLGVLEFLDAATLRVIETSLGPKYGPLASHAIQIIAGVMTARRGHFNSKQQ